METDERNSTGDTMFGTTGVYRNIVQSPGPICMFYFCHPFGISTPGTAKLNNNIYRMGAYDTAAAEISNLHQTYGVDESKRYRHHGYNRQLPKTATNQWKESCGTTETGSTEQSNRTSLIPWPMETWKNDLVLPTLVQLIARQKGRADVPDLEELLISIREAWNTPTHRSIHYRCCECDDSDCSGTSSVTSSLFELNRSRIQSRRGDLKFRRMIASGSYGGLRRRRYSLPEIIMRKYVLDCEKSAESKRKSNRSTTTSENTPPTPSPQQQQPAQQNSSGSESNLLNRGHIMNTSSGEMNMRKVALLRQLWNKDGKRYGDINPDLLPKSSGGRSPQFRRIHRRSLVHSPNSSQCEECAKLCCNQSNDEDELIAPKGLNFQSVDTANCSTPYNKHRYSEVHDFSGFTCFASPIKSSSDIQDTSEGSMTDTSSKRNKKPIKSHSLPSTKAPVAKDLMTELDTFKSEESLTTDHRHNIDINQRNKINPEPTANNQSSNNNNNVIDQTSVADTVTPLTVNPSADSVIKLSVTNPLTNNSESIVSRISNTEIETSSGHATDTPSTEMCSISLNEREDNNANDIRTTSDLDAIEKEIDNFVAQILIDNLNNVVELPKCVSDCMNENERCIELNARNDDIKNGNTPSNIHVYTATTTIEIYEDNLSGNTRFSSVKVDDLNNGDFNVTQTIYFPRYSAESKGDVSIYSSLCSEIESLENSDNSSLSFIPVNTGSTYPLTDRSHPIVVQRLANMQRTHSLEVRPSSASDYGDNGGNESDETSSLVDSLEEPLSPKHGAENQAKMYRDKIEAFFVPIVDDIQQSSEQSEVAISVRLPNKIRERLEKRQDEMNQKRVKEQQRRQELEHKQIGTSHNNSKADEKRPSKISPSKFKSNEPGLVGVVGKTGKVKKCERKQFEPPKVEKPKGKKTQKALRSEIGLLESYTIDTRGNIQFRNGENHRGDKAILKQQPQRKIGTVVPPKKDEIINIKNGLDKQSKSTKELNNESIKRDVQHMTLYETTGTELTPDLDGGPKRMYQKTEIHEGEKQIEILEIVECDEISSEESNSNRSSKSSGHMKRSRIPIPIKKSTRQIVRGNRSNNSSREPSPVPMITRPIHTPGSNRVDRVIADLLIEAINRPEEIGIEVIRSSKEFRTKAGIKKKPKRTKRSPINHGSAKYQQIFEVIPEEKGNQSVNSSGEEKPNEKSIERRSSGSSGERKTSRHSMDGTDDGNAKPMMTTYIVPPPVVEDLYKEVFRNNRKDSKPSSPTTLSYVVPRKLTPPSRRGSPRVRTNLNKSSRGKEATVNEVIEPSAWVGFFRRNDGSIDSMNEDDQFITPRENHSPKVISTENSNSTKSMIRTESQKSNSSTTTTTVSQRITTFANPESQPASTDSEHVPTVIEDVFISNRSESTINTNTHSIDCFGDKSCEQCKNIAHDLISNSGFNTSNIKSTSTPLQTESRTVQTINSSISTSPKYTQSEQNPPWMVSIGTDSNQNPITYFASTQTDGFEIYTNESELKDKPNSNTSRNSREKCNECCFCNPLLHTDLIEPPGTSRTCNFCSHKPTKAADSKVDPEINIDDKTNGNDEFVETMTKRDHVHIRSRSKGSDMVSTKCTKVNQTIRRVPLGSEHLDQHYQTDTQRKETQRNSPNPILKRIPSQRKSTDVINDNLKKKPSSFEEIKNPTKKIPTIRLPSPFTGISSHSYDSMSCSSSSSSPLTPKKSTSVLPAAQPRLSHHLLNNQQGKELMRKRNSRYNDFYNNKTMATNRSQMSNATSNNQGWSVTVAGRYHQDMAPDVEMKLSFPKHNEKVHKNERNQAKQQHVRREFHYANGNLFYEALHNDDHDGLRTKSTQRTTSLPPATTYNPKRTLTRQTNERSVINAQAVTPRRYNLPEVNKSKVNSKTAKKAIKRVKCSVAVASATQTISNYARGQRAMSFAAINHSDAFQYVTNDDRIRPRDHSVDLGNISSSRLSVECHTPIGVDAAALSVLGNAIAPERKPPVPTMSERDLTRRHAACFTRNRAFFS